MDEWMIVTMPLSPSPGDRTWVKEKAPEGPVEQL